jgi:hypothetical protein
VRLGDGWTWLRIISSGIDISCSGTRGLISWLIIYIVGWLLGCSVIYFIGLLVG